MVPEAKDLDPSGWRDLESVIDRALHDRPAALVRRLRLFLRLLEWLAVPRYGRRFSALDPRRRHRFLVGLQESRLSAIRVGFWGLRTLALMGYYGRPEAARAIGYAPRPEGWEALR